MSRYYDIYDRIVAVQSQTVFNTSKPYISGKLMVYLNGLLVRNGEDLDYIEVDPTTIQFNYELEEGDEVIISSKFSSGNYTVDVITNNSRNNNAIYKKYSSANKLYNNQQYSINISLKNQQINWNFSSKCDPFFVTINKIRRDTGDLLDEVKDSQIAHVIYTNSKELQLNKDIYDDNNTSSDTDTLSIRALEHKMTQWVRYKCNIDITNSIYLSLCGASGTTLKRLDSLSIEREVSLPDLEDMLNMFKQKFQSVQNIFDDSTILTQTYTKASTNYTYTSRGTF